MELKEKIYTILPILKKGEYIRTHNPSEFEKDMGCSDENFVRMIIFDKNNPKDQVIKEFYEKRHPCIYDQIIDVGLQSIDILLGCKQYIAGTIIDIKDIPKFFLLTSEFENINHILTLKREKQRTLLRS